MRQAHSDNDVRGERLYLGETYGVYNEIGRGSYGAVYRAICERSGQTCAIKKFKSALSSAARAKNCLREIEILSKLHHPNVVRPIASYCEPGRDTSVYIVMELQPSDLRKLFHTSLWLEPIHVKKLLYETLLGLNYVHSAGVVHRDIKPGNLLVNELCEVKLCDFGLARTTAGLKSGKFDFDPIYREELENLKDNEEEDTIPEEFEEEMAPSRTVFNLPGRFDVGIGRVHDRVTGFTKPAMDQSSGRLKARSESLSGLQAKGRSRKEVLKSNFVRGLEFRRQQLIDASKASGISQRELTSHIATRWYRAPEIVLMDKVYTSAVDIWGLGCVFAELLQMLPGNATGVETRKPLFPGNTCYPLSPMVKCASSCCVTGLDVCPDENLEGDQLTKILSVIGSPSEDEASFLMEKGARDYVKMMPKFEKVDFAKRFPKAPAEALDLLGKMLRFNPYRRITAKEALEHPFLAEVRCAARETEASHISLESDKAKNYTEALVSLCT